VKPVERSRNKSVNIWEKNLMILKQIIRTKISETYIEAQMNLRKVRNLEAT